ncbi:hypothetical protein [Yinghuangia sp. YIM S09857]|uniref:hypothetical protein n=1 Tax=Yinghuangia sp. YIM S09857 TaxID=3436929 RepID=UPI003F531ED2
MLQEYPLLLARLTRHHVTAMPMAHRQGYGTVRTAIAINLERITAHLPPAPELQFRSPTALQRFLDVNRIPRPRSWRATG